MTPQYCLVNGDCWRACVATVLDLPTSIVPHFMASRDVTAGFAHTRDWLEARGLGLFETYSSANWTLDRLLEVFSKPSRGVPVIVVGRAKSLPTELHAVVALNGEVVHDPSGAGLVGPWPCEIADCDCGMAWWWLYVITGHASTPTSPAQTGEGE